MSAAAAENAFPPILNNMGGLNPTGDQKPQQNTPFLYFCGLDQLTETFCIDWCENWNSDAAKEKNWKGEGTVPICQPKPGNILGSILDGYHLQAVAKQEPIPMPEYENGLMQPQGGKIGGKWCRFKIEIESCIILIADHQKYRGDYPNVKMEISGTQCLCYPGGSDAAFKDGLRYLEDVLGASIHKERVSRADVCIDLPAWSMDLFMELSKAGFSTCRSKHHVPYDVPGGRSLYWGKSSIVLRIYDKLAEMNMKALRGQPAKYEHMVQKRWGGEVPASAVRVEFQLRRDALKAFGISGYDSLMTEYGDMLRYLTGIGATLDRWSKTHGGFIQQHEARWFRFLTKKPDHKNPRRNKVHPEWAIVQKVFCDRFGAAEVLREIEPEKVDIGILVKQGFGVMETAACNRGYAIPGKTSTAPQLYKFGSYESFEAWMCAEMRQVAMKKGEWDLKEKLYTEIDEEIDAMDLEHWLNEPLPDDVLEMIRLENLIEEEKEAELIGA